MYDDGYPTCAKTYSTLLIYPGEIDPAVITDRLGIEPSSWQRRGEVAERADRPPRVATIHSWFLTSKDQVDSRDSRRHIDWLLARVASKAEAIRSLQELGCRLTISCYWLSRSGHGGPIIPASQMRKLGELNLELWLDVYGPCEDETPIG